MKILKITFFSAFAAIAALILASCLPANRASPTPPGPGTQPEPGASPAPTSSGGPNPGTPTASRQYSLIALHALQPLDILVQQDYEPGFFRPEASYPFGRLPPFTLFADGALIYIAEGQTSAEERIMQVQLSDQESIAFVQKVLDYGFERLESYTKQCREKAGGEQTCVADASTTILRARLPSNKLREVKIYADFANDPQAFDSIRSYLSGYKDPAARPYVPQKATLFLRPLESQEGITVQDWPLDPRWLEFPATQSGMWAWALGGDELEKFLGAVPRNTGDFYFKQGGKLYAAYLAPWLPGQDYTEAIAAEFPPPAPEAPAGTATPAPAVFSECPLPPAKGPASSGVTWRVAYASQGNVWVADDAREPAALTRYGDVEQVKLTPDGKTILFTRKVGEKRAELWAVRPDGKLLRRLAGGGQPLRQIELDSFSSDGQMVAFTNLVDENNGELWVASVDGSGARRLVGVEDLKSILQGDFTDLAGVRPTQVLWVPHTYTLTYDAYPVAEGIYIYVQNQAMAVDALSGSLGVLFPPDEGGFLSYSPDGTQMAIITPRNLSLMNVEEKDRQPAPVNYFALGMGEYYVYPPLVWAPDSRSLLLALAAEEGYRQDGKITVFRVSADGSTATRLSEFAGFLPSVAFSPDQRRVAYWLATPQSNRRELHIAKVDGSEDILYARGDSLDFLGWVPGSQRFLYWDGDAGQPLLGDICAAPQPLGDGPRASSPAWIDSLHYLFTTGGENDLQLYLGTLGGPSKLLGSLVGFGSYDWKAFP